MNTLSMDDLRSLVEARTGPFVSLSLPTHRASADTRQNPIRFKKLLRDAEERLSHLGARAADTQQILEPARRLLEDTLFWQHQGEGLVVFASPKMFRYYQLPMKPEELVVVGDRFHIKPILQLLTGDCHFYILALSQNKVRLLEATRHSAREVELKSMPESLAQALKYDQPEKQVQFRTRPGNAGGAGRGGAVFYGQGAGVEIAKDRILRYFHQVDDGLRKQLKDQRAPLVFAGVDYLFPIYREVNTYSTLMDEAILGNPDDLNPDELHRRAWAIVQPFFSKKEQTAAAYYRQLAGTNRTSHTIGQVAPAAFRGRVELLFVPIGVQQWGTFAPEVDRVHEYDAPQPGSEDMLDFAAAHTLLHGGVVYAVTPQHMPNGSPVAAVLRY